MDGTPEQHEQVKAMLRELGVEPLSCSWFVHPPSGGDGPFHISFLFTLGSWSSVATTGGGGATFADALDALRTAVANRLPDPSSRRHHPDCPTCGKDTIWPQHMDASCTDPFHTTSNP